MSFTSPATASQPEIEVGSVAATVLPFKSARVLMSVRLLSATMVEPMLRETLFAAALLRVAMR